MSSEQIIQQAAQWLTRLHDENVTEADHQAFNTWRQADRGTLWPSNAWAQYGAASTRCRPSPHALP